MGSMVLIQHCFLVLVLGLSSILAFDPNCTDRGSCHRIGNKDFMNRNCECDSTCAVYGDCCYDAANAAFVRRYRHMRSRSSCVALGVEETIGSYMIDRCSNSYRESVWVRSKCFSKDDFSDPIMSTPVTSVSSGMTYKNRYCAECNNASPTALETWSILLDCESLEQFNLNESFMWQSLQYKSDASSWGIQYLGEFHTCHILYDIPSSLSSVVRLCRPGLVSTCPRHWNHRSTRKACESYMGVVYSMNVAYKNKYCALCNLVTEDDYSCDAGNQFFRRKNAFSFALLLDVNNSQGDRVGKKDICQDKEVYDPFFKKCRKVLCALPGFKVVNGKCRRN